MEVADTISNVDTGPGDKPRDDVRIDSLSVV
jgi:hypothetical protein